MNPKSRKVNSVLSTDKTVVKRARDYFQDVMENSRDALFRQDVKTGTFNYLSDSIEALSGYTARKFYEQGFDLWINNIHPDDRHGLLQFLSECRNNTFSGSSSQREYRFRHKDGHWVWVNDTVSIIRNKEGEIEAVVGVFRDMTNQKMNETSRMEAKQKFLKMFQTAAEGIVIVDIESRKIQYANEAFCEMLGYTEDEALQMHVDDYHADGQLQQMRADFEKIAKGEKVTTENKFLRKDGTLVDVRVNAALISENTKQVFGLFTDITSQKQAERELKAGKERFKRLSEATFEAIVIHDQGNIIDVNQQCLDMFGYTLEEVKTIPGREMIAPRSRDLVAQKRKTHYEGAYKAFGMKKDGTIFPVQIQSKGTVMNGKPVRISAIRDMTAESRQEQLFEAVLQSSQDLILVLDENSVYLYANQTSLDYVDLKRDQVVGKSIYDVFPDAPDFAQLWADRIKDAFRTGKPGYFEDSVDIGDRRVSSESVLSPIRYPGGEMFAVSLVYRDVTEMKDIRSLYKRLIEATFDGILFHENSKIIEANQQFADMFGYTLDELAGLNGLELFAPESRETARQKIESQDETPYGATGLKKDGTTFPMEVHGRNIHLGGRSIRVAMVLDLTKQKKLQEQLQESERKYRELYDNAQVALFRTALDGTLLDCNRACLAVFGFSPDEPEQNDFNKIRVTDHHVDKARRQAFIDALMQKKRIDGFEAELKKVDGSTFWVSFSAEVFPEAGCIEGVLYDITVKKLLTKTERKVLGLLLQGLSNKQIARELDRSIRTIEDHRASVMRKLNVDNAFDLAKKALPCKFEETPKS